MSLLQQSYSGQDSSERMIRWDNVELFVGTSHIFLRFVIGRILFHKNNNPIDSNRFVLSQQGVEVILRVIRSHYKKVNTLNSEILLISVLPIISNSEQRVEKVRTGEILARFHFVYHIINPFPEIQRVRFSFCRVIPKGRVIKFTFLSAACLTRVAIYECTRRFFASFASSTIWGVFHPGKSVIFLIELSTLLAMSERKK